jgi:hypothetical protein
MDAKGLPTIEPGFCEPRFCELKFWMKATIAIAMPAAIIDMFDNL